MTNTDFKVGVIKPVECFKEGWELIKDEYWLFFGITLVGMLLGGIIPLALGIGAMYCGIYHCLLRKMDRQPLEFGDLFKGFNWFLPGLMAMLILIVPIIIFVIISYGSIFGILFSSMDKSGKINESAIVALYGVVFGESLVFALISGCIHAFIMFAFPLIVDKNLSGFDAFKLSAKAAWANLSGVVGLILCQFALGFVGSLACGIGVYFVLPISFAGIAIAYRKVFPPLNPNNFNNPPSPSAFRGAGNYN
jgi:hypothetical protein